MTGRVFASMESVCDVRKYVNPGLCGPWGPHNRYYLILIKSHRFVINGGFLFMQPGYFLVLPALFSFISDFDQPTSPSLPLYHPSFSTFG
jgi:hypothetical protein